MKLTVNTNDTYIPSFNGNKELAESEQIKIIYRMPSVKINESLANLKFNFSADGEVSGTTELTRRKVCAMFIKEIKGLEVEVDEKLFKIRSADDLFSDKAPATLEPLCDELFEYFNKVRKSEVDEKN